MMKLKRGGNESKPTFLELIMENQNQEKDVSNQAMPCVKQDAQTLIQVLFFFFFPLYLESF